MCISVYNDYYQYGELLFYMRMDEQKRKESILNRIALANVGLLVSYVKIEDISIIEVKGEVEVSYTITV
ncbi:hypothetical protein [Shouchella miscanthi]|uniref:Uncharacterized protein n=1 Tax=Shouchella miscanthi TaxID=2598861 RepID=A0ABU6NNJ5_9BACI|nr:hypothetical protein [Shouchella miscanthi]